MDNQTELLNVSDEIKLNEKNRLLRDRSMTKNCVLLHQTLLKNCILRRHPTHVETVCLLTRKAQ